MKNADKPAFPGTTQEYNYDRSEWIDVNKPGLTKREYFAAMAMQGLLSCRAMEKISNNMGLPDLTTVAQEAVAYADHLLQQLES